MLGNGDGNKFVSDAPSLRNSGIVPDTYRYKSCFELERIEILDAAAGALFVITTETRIDDSDATREENSQASEKEESGIMACTVKMGSSWQMKYLQLQPNVV